MNEKVISGVVICLVGVALNFYRSGQPMGEDGLHISLGPILIGLAAIISGLADEKRAKEKNEFLEKASLGQVTREDWHLRGAESFRFKEYDEAIKSFDMAIKMDPDYVDAWINKGSALYELGMYSDAIAAYDQVIRLQPQKGSAWKRKGYALQKLDMNQEAKAAFSRAEELGYR